MEYIYSTINLCLFQHFDIYLGDNFSLRPVSLTRINTERDFKILKARLNRTKMVHGDGEC